MAAPPSPSPALLLPLLLCVLTLGQVLGDHWSSWSDWSACSRTCGGGATFQQRKCIRSYIRRSGCEGESIRYDTCNNEECPPGSMDFRDQQCAAYNNASYGGVFYQWLPYMDRKNPCALYCIARGNRTVVRLAPKVLDGTRCKANALDMCINGQCWGVGCDHVLGSTVEFDLCGVCGGNNSCFSRLPRERFHWMEGGFAACSASCGVGEEASTFRCVNRYTGRRERDYLCHHLQKPTPRTRPCFLRLCPPAWKIEPWQACSQTCGGGVAVRNVRCMDALSDGRHRWLHDSFCPAPKPSSSKHCNKIICPRWYAGEWSPCSVTCGWGQQYREVVCRHEGSVFCDEFTKPLTVKNCTTNFPCFDPDERRYVAEHDEGANTQEFSLGELRESQSEFQDLPEIHEDDIRNHNMSTPKYVVSSWGPCSATCGSGVKRRYVRCQVFLKFLGDIVDLADSECEVEPKPRDTAACLVEPCYEDYNWRNVGLTPCSRSCLGGVQETLLECVHKENGTLAPSLDYCARAPSLPIERRVCNDLPCPQRWRIGDFGACSTTCDGGVMERTVECVQEYATGEDNVLLLPDVMCDQPVPQRQRACNSQHCPASWVAGDWSDCSATCGEGVVKRPVVCQRQSANGVVTDVSDKECRPSMRPLGEKPCNVSACPQVKIKQTKMKFFQLNKMKKVRLVVGTDAAVLPGTSVVVRCPAKAFNKRKIRWMRDGRPVPRRGRRVHVSGKGNLKIKRSRPDKDSGTYECEAGGMRAKVTLTFSDLMALLEQTVVREKYLLGYLSDSANNASNSALFKDPFDRKLRPLQVVMSEWTPCSVTCGGGLRKRNVTCEIITNDYFEEFPIRVCKRAGLHIPDTLSHCNSQPCVRWSAGNWTECSVDQCKRRGFALQTREVLCVREDNSSQVEEALCSQTDRPLQRIECIQRSCRPVWNTSEWSECLADCGKEGFQTRMLTCIWEATGRSAGRLCEDLQRPVVMKNCWAKPCVNSCMDESEYCSMARHLRLCRFTNFRQSCCKSCENDTAS